MAVLLSNNDVLQNAATTGNGRVVDLLGQSRYGVVYVEWGSANSIGTIVVEHNGISDTYTGTWAPLGTVAFSGTAPKVDAVQFDGAVKFIRARFSVNSDVAATVRMWVN